MFVAFTLDGRKYEGRLGYYISGMYVGKDIKLYYNPANPADFRGSGRIISSIFFAVFGGVFLTIGLIPLLLSGKKRFLSGRKHRRRDGLIQKGRRIDVKVAEIYRNTRVSVNGAHPYKIRCRGFDHLGQLREFESEDIWHDPAPRIEQLRIKSLPVYLHETKPRKYYVDIRALQSS